MCLCVHLDMIADQRVPASTSPWLVHRRRHCREISRYIDEYIHAQILVLGSSYMMILVVILRMIDISLCVRPHDQHRPRHCCSPSSSSGNAKEATAMMMMTMTMMVMTTTASMAHAMELLRCLLRCLRLQQSHSLRSEDRSTRAHPCHRQLHRRQPSNRCWLDRWTMNSYGAPSVSYLALHPR